MRQADTHGQMQRSFSHLVSQVSSLCICILVFVLMLLSEWFTCLCISTNSVCVYVCTHVVCIFSHLLASKVNLTNLWCLVVRSIQCSFCFPPSSSFKTSKVLICSRRKDWTLLSKNIEDPKGRFPEEKLLFFWILSN